VCILQASAVEFIAAARVCDKRSEFSTMLFISESYLVLSLLLPVRCDSNGTGNIYVPYSQEIYISKTIVPMSLDMLSLLELVVSSSLWLTF
jgi:hypothetical protein